MDILLDKETQAIVQRMNDRTRQLIAEGKIIVPQPKKSGPQEIIIKAEALDTSKLQEGQGTKQYRPNTLDEYIGQQRAKDRITTYFNGCKREGEPFPHTFLSAQAGHGKTLLAEIIANMLNLKCVKTTGGELKSEQQFIDKVVECDGGIIFIDEANRINKRVGFFMLPVIEKFEVGNKSLKPFTVIFATTHIGDISKDLDALIQRCDLKLELEHYNTENLVTILKNYHTKQYPRIDVEPHIYEEVAKNCRKTPRIARTLLREYIFTKNWNQVKENYGIIKDGITHTDVKILKYLVQFDGVGMNTLANFLRVKPQTYQNDMEPYLVHSEFITVSNHRKITEQGKLFLKELQ